MIGEATAWVGLGLLGMLTTVLVGRSILTVYVDREIPAPYVKCEQVQQGFFEASVYETRFHEANGLYETRRHGLTEVEAVNGAWAEYEERKRIDFRASEWRKHAPPPTYYQQNDTQARRDVKF